MSALSTRRSCQTIFHFLANTNSTTKSCLPSLVHIRNAHHKSESRANGAKNGPGKRLGAKKGSEEYVIPGNIIFRQRGTQWFPGENCDMGRDHTIFAKEAGYVQFYRDPHRHPRRRYIGVALERTWKLPTPPNAVRRRRLGMLAVERKDIDLEALSERRNADITTSIPANPEPPMTDKEKRTARRREKSGLIPVKDLVMKRGYQWRMTNPEIGRIAERAGVQKPVFRKGDRFLALRIRRKNAKKAAVQRIADAEAKRGKEIAKQKAKSEKDGARPRRPRR